MSVMTYDPGSSAPLPASLVRKSLRVSFSLYLSLSTSLVVVVDGLSIKRTSFLSFFSTDRGMCDQALSFFFVVITIPTILSHTLVDLLEESICFLQRAHLQTSKKARQRAKEKVKLCRHFSSLSPKRQQHSFDEEEASDKPCAGSQGCTPHCPSRCSGM